MPRQIRQKSESGHYHVIVRGTNRQAIFNDEADKERFLSTLVRYKKELGFKLHAYCLMTNHVHLLIEDKDDNLALIMKKISVSYVIYFNNKYKRTGHLFEDRFKSAPINDDKYFLTVMRYIHNNHVKAGMAEIDEYPWSSYSDYISSSGITDTEMILELVGGIKGFVEFNTTDDERDHLAIRIDLTDDEIIEKLRIVAQKDGVCSMLKSELHEYIRKLKEQGFAIYQISEALGCGRNIVRQAIGNK